MENVIETGLDHDEDKKTGSDHDEEDKKSCPLFDELVFEILEWLPFATVMRFRCVSKQWFRKFRTHSFARNHSRKHGSTNTMLLIRRCVPSQINNGDQEELFSFHDLDSIETEVRPALPVSFFKDILELDKVPNQFSFIGSCHGIVCIKYGARYILYNPALQELKFLPDCSINFPRGFGKRLIGQGFGVTSHTSTNDDVKVVIMHSILNLKKRPSQQTVAVMVHLYSLRSDSWRQIDDAPGYPVTQSKSHMIFLKGACHWVGRTFANDRRTILSFDIDSEAFRRQLELPDCLCRSDIAYPTPVVLNGCLGVVQFRQWVGSTDPVEVWVMKEYGVKESWTREFIMSPQPMAMALLPWKNNMLMVNEPSFVLPQEQRQHGERPNCHLTSLALHTNEREDFQVYGVQKSMRMVIYEVGLLGLIEDETI